MIQKIRGINGLVKAITKKNINTTLYEGLTYNKVAEADEKKLFLAFRPTGGLGDYIISLKLLDELMSYCPTICDVFCENLYFGDAIYGHRDNVEVVPANDFDRLIKQYDLVITAEHFVHVHTWNPFKLAKLSLPLCQKISTLRAKWEYLFLNIDKQCYREAMHFKQCEFLGINRYTELNMGNIFSIKDKKVNIHLLDNARDRWKELGLENISYITLNYGADKMNTNKLQIKVWPMVYYEKFCELFRNKYPNIRIIQVGGKGNEKIKGVDQYILGENLEVSKWILKESLLHIDCEGGLVHLATQLGAKCAVIFGPTPIHMYAYEQNINLVSSKCSNCMGMHEKWAFECYRGLDKPECMYDITPEKLMSEISFSNGMVE